MMLIQNELPSFPVTFQSESFCTERVHTSTAGFKMSGSGRLVPPGEFDVGYVLLHSDSFWSPRFSDVTGAARTLDLVYGSFLLPWFHRIFSIHQTISQASWCVSYSDPFSSEKFGDLSTHTWHVRNRCVHSRLLTVSSCGLPDWVSWCFGFIAFLTKLSG